MYRCDLNEKIPGRIVMALRKNPKYDLKENYNKALIICMSISLFITIAAFEFSPEFEVRDQIKPDTPDIPNFVPPPPTSTPSAPPPPPKPFTLIESPEDILEDDIELESTELNMNEQVPEIKKPPAAKDKSDEYFPFRKAEDKPQIIGGVAGIMKKIDYPDMAKKLGISGLVIVEVYVDEHGEVQKIVLLKGIGFGCDEETINAIKNTKFIPGKQRGVPVKVKVTIPVRFKLK